MSNTKVKSAVWTPAEILRASKSSHSFSGGRKLILLTLFQLKLRITAGNTPQECLCAACSVWHHKKPDALSDYEVYVGL